MKAGAEGSAQPGGRTETKGKVDGGRHFFGSFAALQGEKMAPEQFFKEHRLLFRIVEGALPRAFKTAHVLQGVERVEVPIMNEPKSLSVWILSYRGELPVQVRALVLESKASIDLFDFRWITYLNAVRSAGGADPKIEGNKLPWVWLASRLDRRMASDHEWGESGSWPVLRKLKDQSEVDVLYYNPESRERTGGSGLLQASSESAPTDYPYVHLIPRGEGDPVFAPGEGQRDKFVGIDHQWVGQFAADSGRGYDERISTRLVDLEEGLRKIATRVPEGFAEMAEEVNRLAKERLAELRSRDEWEIIWPLKSGAPDRDAVEMGRLLMQEQLDFEVPKNPILESEGGAAGPPLQVLRKQLQFYKHHNLYELVDRRSGCTRRTQFLFASELEPRSPCRFVPLEFSGRPISYLNNHLGLKLEDEHVMDYLIFFCEAIQSSMGVFRIVEHPDHLRWMTEAREQRDLLERLGLPLRRWSSLDSGPARVDGLVAYHDHLFFAAFKVSSSGMVEMEDDIPLTGQLDFAPIALLPRTHFVLRTTWERLTGTNQSGRGAAADE